MRKVAKNLLFTTVRMIMDMLLQPLVNVVTLLQHYRLDAATNYNALQPNVNGNQKKNAIYSKMDSLLQIC